MANNWREEELSREEVIEKYPDFPPLLVLKIDADRRGVHFTDAAFDLVDPKIHQVSTDGNIHKTKSDGTKKISPVGLTFRDGTVLCKGHAEIHDYTHRDPYILDVVDGKLHLIDQDEVLEEVTFWEKPDFLDKVTSNGTPMSEIATARPQRITLTPQIKCHFWDKPGNGCKYCGLFAETRDKEVPDRDEKYFQDVYETVAEAVKQKGRFCHYHMTSGSTLTGRTEIFDDEVDLYIKTLQAAGRAFKTKKFPVKLVASAFSKKQLQRLYDETGITTYTTDLEVLNERLFRWVCPGKAEFVGYRQWKQRLYDAVDIFGRGNVDCGLVGGVELAQPNGFQSEDEALAAVLKEADEIAAHGVSFAEIVWNTIPGSYFYKQKVPSLEYYVRLAAGLAEVRRKNGLNIYTDDYRRCGNHPNTDLARID